MADWTTLLDEGDFPEARAACLQHFAGRADDAEATGALAEVEERWGDSLFFAGEPGAAEHYRAAGKLLIPPGLQFTSRGENDFRMSAYQRVIGKLRAIDPYGKPRPGHEGRPHPNSNCVQRPPELAIAQPQASEAQSGSNPSRKESDFARLFQDSDHWCHYDLGANWREAGKALAERHPAAARRAYAWSLHFFDLYRAAWSRNLPSSRWDSDGDGEVMEVQSLADALQSLPSEPPLPPWVEALLAGDWRRASAAAGDSRPAPEWRGLAALLAGACLKAREQGAGSLE